MVKLLVISILSSVTLFASDVIMLYKDGGMKAIEKEIAKGMGDISYWSDTFVNKDLRFGYFENMTSLLTCNKDKGSLELYSRDFQKHFSLKKRYSAFTGKNSGDKSTKGDLKTPIGVYTLIEKKKNVDPFYGPMAFVTSYPNLYDRIRGKSGDGIWVHGVPINGTRDPFTHGCIAINNNDLVNLEQSIDYSKTVLIIDSSIKPHTDPISYSSIMANLYKWKYAWTYNDSDTYLSFYNISFKRFDGMNYDQFKAYKERIFSKNETKNIIFDNVNIIPYPGDKKNLYLITFDEIYTTDTHRYQGSKSLLVSLLNDKISILTEE
ncbi:MAG: L,D-transpeptidase family protein [Sulfuricurvum sp.]|nr:L,D-transpeptidase family protein [Sulfuricurvum sp.]